MTYNRTCVTWLWHRALNENCLAFLCCFSSVSLLLLNSMQSTFSILYVAISITDTLQLNVILTNKLSCIIKKEKKDKTGAYTSRTGFELTNNTFPIEWVPVWVVPFLYAQRIRAIIISVPSSQRLVRSCACEPILVNPWWSVYTSWLRWCLNTVHCRWRIVILDHHWILCGI